MKKKIKLLLMVPMLHQGGFERICALTANKLKDIFEVHIVVFTSKDMFYDVSDIDLIDLDLEAVSGKIGKILNILKRTIKVRKIKKKLGIDITYSFGQTANIVNVLSKYKDVTWAGIRGYGALEDYYQMKLVCKLADRMVSCTKIMEKEITNQHKVNSSTTLYNPCNLEEMQKLSKEEIDDIFDEFLNREGKTIVSLGRAHDVKGYWHLLKSVYLVKKQIPNVKLMLIGDDDFTEYMQLARNLGIDKDVLFTGVQKNPFALLAKADIYALTSESEGFPNALIEAMGLGLPCVSVNCKTGPAEILHNNYRECDNQEKLYMADYGILTPIFTGEKDLNTGHITEQEDIFANQLIKLLDGDELYEKYSKAAKQRAAEFSMKAYVESIVEQAAKDIGIR